MESLGTAQLPANPRVRVTYGEILPNRTIIDLVAPAADQDGVDLLRWDGKKVEIAPAIDNGDGIIYERPYLDLSVRQAMTFPGGASEYGTTIDLFRKILNLCREFAGLPEDLAAFATCWIFATWVPEPLLISLILCVSGAPMHQVHKLFRLFGSLCRRALLVAELSRRLPLFLHPTLMVNDPKLSGNARAFWRAASCQGVFVPGTGSAVEELGCAKAVLLRPEDPPDAWGEEAMHLVLPHAELPTLGKPLLASIAAEFQPQLEMFRLHLLSGSDPFVSPTHPLSRFDLASNLGACVPEDPAIIQILTPLFESHQQDISAQRSRDPRVAILEVVWGPSHDQDEMAVGEITKRVNAVLRSRGVTDEYNVREMGWKLSRLGLCTSSNGKRKGLRFSSETRWGLHRSTREFGLKLPFRKDCADCQGLQATEQKPVE